MSERGSLLAGLLMAGLILSIVVFVVLFAVPRSRTIQTNLNGGTDAQNDGSITGPIKQAENVKIQTNLKSLSTQMMAYYAEQGAYPNSLAELSSFGGGSDTSNVTYFKCSEESAFFYHNSSGYPGYKFQYGEATPTSGEKPPNCT